LDNTYNFWGSYDSGQQRIRQLYRDYTKCGNPPVEETTYSLIQAGASPAVPQVEAIAANTLAALNPVTVGDQANASKVAKSTAWEQVNKAVEFMAPLALEALMLLI